MGTYRKGLKSRPLDGGYGHYCQTLSQGAAAVWFEVKLKESDQADKYEIIYSVSFSDTSRVLRDGPVTFLDVFLSFREQHNTGQLWDSSFDVMCIVSLLIPADTTVKCNKNKGDLKQWGLSWGISFLKDSFHSKTLISSKYISSYKIKPDLTLFSQIN